MPPAARISDMHACPKVEPGPVPHVGGPVNTGEPTVLIGFMPAARVGDMAICVGPPDSVKKGESTVKIGGKEAARLGDPMSHGGVIVAGCPTVIIGSGPQAEALRTDKPFCEECERKKKEREARKKKRLDPSRGGTRRPAPPGDPSGSPPHAGGSAGSAAFEASESS